MVGPFPLGSGVGPPTSIRPEPSESSRATSGAPSLINSSLLRSLLGTTVGRMVTPPTTRVAFRDQAGWYGSDRDQPRSAVAQGRRRTGDPPRFHRPTLLASRGVTDPRTSQTSAEN